MSRRSIGTVAALLTLAVTVPARAITGVEQEENVADLLVTRPSNVAELVKGGRLRTLAVSSPTRMPSNPDVPTWKELGIDAVYGNWFGTIGPRGMTPQQVAWWDDTLARLTRHEDWRRELERNMWSDFYLSSKDARRFLDQQNVELRALMTDIGLAKQ